MIRLSNRFAIQPECLTTSLMVERQWFFRIKIETNFVVVVSFFTCKNVDSKKKKKRKLGWFLPAHPASKASNIVYVLIWWCIFLSFFLFFFFLRLMNNFFNLWYFIRDAATAIPSLLIKFGYFFFYILVDVAFIKFVSQRIKWSTHR